MREAPGGPSRAGIALAAGDIAIRASTASDDGVLDAFYRDYDAAFVLPNEKEGFDGFRDCLALNAGENYRRLTALFGPFREYVLVAADARSGAPIGGANFIVFLHRRDGQIAQDTLSVNLNYIFVNKPVRGAGWFKRLVLALPDVARRLLAATNPGDLAGGEGDAMPLLMFIEQNDPYRMPPADYRRDTEATGLDQLARIAIWARLGAKIVDFPYVQPPLTAQQGADENLAYGVLGAATDTLDACLLRRHLERFFGISVLKGADPNAEPHAAAQLQVLARMCAGKEPVRLLAATALDRAPSPLRAAAPARPNSLRDLLRG